MGFFSRKEKLDEGLAKTRKGFFAGILDMMNAGSIDDSFYDDLEDQLILADAGADEADRLVTALRQRVRHEHIKNAADAMAALKSIIVEELRADGPMDLSGRPAVIMVIGVNGVGKTTSIAKLARLYKSQGKSVLLAAGDTFRAAAAEQPTIWAGWACRWCATAKGPTPPPWCSTRCSPPPPKGWTSSSATPQAACTPSTT